MNARPHSLIALGLVLGLLPSLARAELARSRRADVVVVGAGIAGLSAALEAARAGRDVLVVDMGSVFGGHAIMSHGGVWAADTPLQRQKGFKDDPELAFQDMVRWGGDVDKEWAHDYVTHSATDIYGWMEALGVHFEKVIPIAGNSVPRFHRPAERGYGLVAPLYRACLKAGVSFAWNVRVDRLKVEDDPKSGKRVSGFAGTDLRTGEPFEVDAQAVVVATGGFQSNLAMVRSHWPKGLPQPKRLLRGSGINSEGLGLVFSEQVGAATFNLDHQWNYSTGLPDPNHPGEERGLHAFDDAGIWVNERGRRFTNDDWLEAGNKATFQALMKQPDQTYWLLFDDSGKGDFVVSGTGWSRFEVIDEKILKNPSLTRTGDTLEALARATGLPAKALVETVRRYNEMVAKGTDLDFGRFKDGHSAAAPASNKTGPLPPRIEKPPFYALQLFPLARKSMGGLRIDREARVLDRHHHPIPGLYAAGEVTGFAGINGSAGLEGTFLGPCIFTGRVAGRSAAAAVSSGPRPAPAPPAAPAPAPASEPSAGLTCLDCHKLPYLVTLKRPGYWHFEKVHQVVLEKKLPCQQCHAELEPYTPEHHRVDPVARIDNCRACHL